MVARLFPMEPSKKISNTAVHGCDVGSEVLVSEKPGVSNEMLLVLQQSRAKAQSRLLLALFPKRP